MNTVWTRHIRDPKAKADFESILKNNTQIFQRLKEILEEREAELNKQSFSEADFTDPNWSHKQAHRLGRLGEITKIKEILP
jgi:hypothetical protein